MTLESILLLAAAGLTLGVVALHSLAGERRLIRPLLASSALPDLGHGLWYTRTLIRAAWHVTSLAWLGLAAVMLTAALQPALAAPVWILPVALTFGLSGLVSLVASKGRHPGWLGLLPISALLVGAALV